MQKHIFLLILCLLSLQVNAHIHGIVLDNEGEPLAGANLHWLNTTEGTTTDSAGIFALEPSKVSKILVTSYLGYRSDTVTVKGHNPLAIVLFPEDMEIDDVTITARKQAVIHSRISAFNTQTLTSAELCKAACCNLSESFETSAAVDVAYSDAVTGAKQIRLLGLAGTYVQLLTENTPQIRGLAQNFGMEYIPGPWMESIQVSKGTSSVVNGYESTTGQINVEFLKPKTQDPVAINLMLNTDLCPEVNITGGWDVSPENIKHSILRGNDGVYTGVLAHAKLSPMKMDSNKDGFVDMPMGYNINLLNRWEIFRGDYTGRILVRGLYDMRLAGQRHDNLFTNSDYPSEAPSPYLIDLRTRRVEGFMKNGYVIDDDEGMSIGIITSGSYHSQDNIYGLRHWKASQANAYMNAMFQTNFTEEHKLTTGISMNHDTYRETITGEFKNTGFPSSISATTGMDLSRRETSIGAFAEYDYKPNEKLSLLIGLRYDIVFLQYLLSHNPETETLLEYHDYSSRHQHLPTPRVNIRYSPWEWWTIRASVGMGYRMPNALADNAAYIPSSRTLQIKWNLFANNIKLGKCDVESAVNTGLTTTFHIPIGDRELQLSAEYYYTYFISCLNADIETNGILRVDNTQYTGRAYAHTMQAEASMEILRGWTMTLAYRLNDSRQTVYSPQHQMYAIRERSLQNRWKGIITTSYQTPLKHWQFDFTAQFNGEGRMPEQFVIPTGSTQYYTKTVTERLSNGHTPFYTKSQSELIYHRWYPQLLAQITKYWRTCSLYVGAENMSNFTQDQPVIGANEPFGDDFDASQVWAPVTGWKIYAGFRWNFNKKEE